MVPSTTMERPGRLVATVTGIVEGWVIVTVLPVTVAGVMLNPFASDANAPDILILVELLVVPEAIVNAAIATTPF